MAMAALRSVIPAALLCAAALIVTGCGGGGGGGTAATPPTPPPTSNNPPPLVAGSETALISAVLTTTGDSAVPAQEVSNGILLSRLLVDFKSDATVGQVNAAARVVGATRITSSEPGSPLVVLQVPRQASVAAIMSLARTMRAQPGVVFALPGQTAKTSVLPEFSPGVPVSTIALGHLLGNRFPQAWNARQTIASDCLPHSVNVYVVDRFGDPRSRPDFFGQVDQSSFIADPSSPAVDLGGHGYDVVSTLAAKFDADLPTGANPFDDCVLVHARDAQDNEFLDVVRDTLHAVAADPEPRVVVNFSINFPDDGFCAPPGVDQPCDATTTAALTHGDTTVILLARVAAAVEWAKLTRTLGLQDKMLVVQAAGNIDPEPAGFLARNYLGFRLAKLSSPAALATHLDEVRTLFADPVLWKSATLPALPDWTFTADDLDAFDEPPLSPTNDIDAANLVIVESGTSGEVPADVRQSEFDLTGADVRAVGEDVALAQKVESGTSFAAPLTAGLASYLWNLSPALVAQPASVTADLLKQSSAHVANSSTVPVLDAYAAVLRLDDVPGCCSGASTRPTRSGLLDVNGDGVFDALDVQKFVDAYGLNDPNTPTIPIARDYSRFDLNGDGYTGGILIEPFDLDVNGLDANKQPLINSADATIEGYHLSFNEAALSDLQILCYYAYSPLYFLDAAGQNEQLRTDLLGPDFCVGARLDVQLPAQISSSGTLNTVVEVPDGHGSFARAPNVFVELTTTCGTASPASGRTDANGALAATVTPGQGCTSVSVRVLARADSDTRPLAQQVVSAVVTGGSNCPAPARAMAYIITDVTETKQGANVNDLLQLVDSLSDNLSSTSIIVGSGFIEGRAAASRLRPLFGTGGTHDSGALNIGLFQDSLVVNPADPALLGRQGTFTFTFRVIAESTVSGQRASARWSLGGGSILATPIVAVNSTVAGQSRGDVAGGTYSTSGRLVFGAPIGLELELRSSVRYECEFDNSCAVANPDNMGSGSIHATLRWQGMTVRDPFGNEVPFSVCSASGTDYAVAQ